MKHKKLRNTGILFELLTRQITSDTLNQVEESPAIQMVSRYFKKGTPLAKELNLYQTIATTNLKTEEKANRFIDVVIEEHGKLSKKQLRNQKYSLVRECVDAYGHDFFNTQIPNYKLNASIYLMFEGTFKTPVQKMNTRYTLVETIIGERVEKSVIEDEVIAEYRKQDEDLRTLSFKILVEKFNADYGHLDKNQRALLKEYINSVSNTPRLKSYVDECTVKLGKVINHFIPMIEDEVTRIKLSEVVNQYQEIRNDRVVRDKHIFSVLRSYELVRELKNVATK